VRLTIDSEGGWIGPIDPENAEEKVRARLRQWLEDAGGRLAAGPLPADATRGLTFAADELAHIPLLIEAAEAGDTWLAVLYALRVGHSDGRWTAHPQAVRSARKVTALEPHARRGKKVLESASQGGQNRTDRPEKRPEAIRDAIRLKAERPGLNWTDLCRMVGKRFSRGRTTMDAWLRDTEADWRRRTD